MNNNKILIPAAIIVAGIVLAGVLYFTRTPGTETTSANSGTQTLADGQKVEVRSFAAPGVPAKVDPKFDYILGSKDADVFVVEYSDLECPFCKEYHTNVVDKISKEAIKSGKVAFIMRQFPISAPLSPGNLHPSSLEESKAMECVGQIGGDEKYYEFASIIFGTTKSDGKFPVENLPEVVKEFGLDKTKFESCMADPKTFAKIKNSFDEGVNAGVQGTPTVFIVGRDGLAQLIPNDKLNKEVVEAIIGQYLK